MTVRFSIYSQRFAQLFNEKQIIENPQNTSISSTFQLIHFHHHHHQGNPQQSLNSILNSKKQKNNGKIIHKFPNQSQINLSPFHNKKYREKQ
jgi:hypothetical protein